ncbi:MAG: pitrilysin family protein [Planctomycetota bacterium]|nr:pitrilysin family protein [Planctomycetota bacterium]
MPEFRETTLSNGLRVAAEIDSRGYSAALGYFVQAGSRNETDQQSGLSHFLEHMMFKGTEKRSAADVSRELDELGGQGNAYTTEEQTVYYATVLPKFQDKLVDLLTDMLSPALSNEEFEVERKVILEEIAKYEDQPPFGAFERSMEVHYGPRGLGRRVLGTAESIRAMTASKMREYFSTMYRPDNMVLAATGNIDFDGLVNQVEKLTISWNSRPDVSSVGFQPDDPQTLPDGIALDHHLYVPDLHQSYLVRIGDGPSESSSDRYASRVLASILGDEGGSRMFWDLIDTGRAEVATVWPHEFTDCGAWFTYLVCSPDDLIANRKQIESIFNDVALHGVTDDELNQTINKASAGIIMQSERPSNRLFGLGSRWLTNQEHLSTDDRLNRIRSVTVDDVSSAAKTYFDGGHFNEIVVSSEEK